MHLIDFLRRRLRLARAWFGSRRCVCGQMRLYGASVELAGVKRRADGPCYHCDAYGNPL